MILLNLPYYQDNPSDLDRGLRVPGEVSSTTKIKTRLKLLVCDESIGSTGIAEEVKGMLSDRRNDYDFIESQNLTLRLQGLDDLSSSSSDDESGRFLSVGSDKKDDEKEGSSSIVGSVSNLSFASDGDKNDNDTNAASLGSEGIVNDDDEDKKLDINSSPSASENNSLLSSSRRSIDVGNQEEDDDEVLYDLTTEANGSEQQSHQIKEVFLLYLSPEVLLGRNKKVLSKVLKKAYNQKMKTLIMYDVDDAHPINFYWGELLNIPFDSSDENLAVVTLVSTSLHFRKTSLRLILETALTI